MNKATLIYGLIDPRTRQLRYVGKTSCSMAKRLRAHLCRTNLTPKRHSSRWLSGLVSSGLSPDVVDIETIEPGGDWQEAERYWIAYFRFVGADLTNIVIGGEGVGGYRMPPERREKMRQVMTGRVIDEAWRAKISAARKGQAGAKQSPGTIAKRVAAMKATRASRPRIERLHCSNGHEFTPENTGFHRNGSKRCKACAHESYQRRIAENPPVTMTREEIRVRRLEMEARPEIRELRKRAAQLRFERPGERERLRLQNVGRPSHMRGDRSPGAKLDWNKVAEIRRRCSNGEARKTVGADYGVSPAVVDRIVWGKTWKPEWAA